MSQFFSQHLRWVASAAVFLSDDVFGMALIGVDQSNGGPLLFDVSSGGTFLGGYVYPHLAQLLVHARVQNDTQYT